jgi:hypothetical protein
MDSGTFIGWGLALVLTLCFVATEIARHQRALPARLIPVSRKGLALSIVGLVVLTLLTFG